MSEAKGCCYSFWWSPEYDHKTNPRPEDCPGLVGRDFVPDGLGGEGYYVQVCPRTAWLGRTATGINFCGNGPDVLVLHQEALPSRAEFEQAVIDYADIF